MEDRVVPYDSVRSLGRGPVLVLAPHADDEVFGCGGAILRHVEAEDLVRVVIATDGGGGLPITVDADTYIDQRRTESRKAGRSLGYGEPEFWDFPDRSLQYGEVLVQRVIAAIREMEARMVYAPSVLEMHPDHRALGMVALEAVRRVGGECWLAMYEIGVPLRPNRLLDITDLRGRKNAAMMMFGSQLAQRDYVGHVEALNRFRAYTLPPEVKSAEAYCLAKADALSDDPMGLYMSEARRFRLLGAPLDQQEEPLLSVIVRSIGRAVLQEALDSLALQTYPRIEVIVVDALGDGHLALPEWCGRFPLRQVGANESLRRGRAANLGLDAARGEYIAFLDDDDLLDPDHFPALVAHLIQHPSLRAAYAGVRVIDTGPEAGAGVTQVFHEPFNERRLVYENYIPIHAVVLHRSLVESGCRFDEELDVYEDWDFWLQVARKTRFGRVDRVSASYRSSGGSGVGLLQQDCGQGLRNRRALYDKWLARWDAKTMDWIFEEYRKVRHEGEEGKRWHVEALERFEEQRAVLEKDYARRESEAAKRERALREQYQELLANHQELLGNHEKFQAEYTRMVVRLEYLENERSRRVMVRVFRNVSSSRLFGLLRRIFRRQDGN